MSIAAGMGLEPFSLLIMFSARFFHVQSLDDTGILDGVKKYRIVFPDMNGALRGKVAAEEFFDINQSVGMVRSVLTAAITGEEISALPEFYIKTGDKDMQLQPDETTLLDVPGIIDYVQVIADVNDVDGLPIEVAPRTLLKRMVDRYGEAGYTAQISSELEFYLYHTDGSQLSRQEADEPYGDINAVERQAALLDEIVELTRQLGLQPEMVLSESGQGQFEVTFSPEQPLFMADRTTYFKQLVREIARKHSLEATFMAQPFLEDAGSGGHIHLSLLKDGKNIFSDEKVLESFVAGQLRYMRSLAPLFAPNANSYRRWEHGHGYIADTVSYGEAVRNVAVRILGEGINRRIEHRLCGADKNAYLTFTAIMAAGLDGIEKRWTYETPVVAAELGQALPEGLASALELFESGAAELLGEEFVRVFAATKRQELELFANATIEREIEAYGQQV